MKYRLGLDLGTNSIGWSVYSLDENNKPAIKIGHHILMYVESVDIKERLTKFRLDKNLTLEEKKIQKKISL